MVTKATEVERTAGVEERDAFYMEKALVWARRAGARDEVPIGAVVVSPTGDIWGGGCNMVEHLHHQGEHAEGRAIRAATKKIGGWRLDGATLYSTLEPCMMCISLAALSRVERIVYGASSPLFGFRLDREGVLTLYTRQIRNITSGVLADESAQLLRDFFLRKRLVHHA